VWAGYLFTNAIDVDGAILVQCAGSTRVQRCAIIYYVSQTFSRRLKHCRYNDIAVISLDASVLWTAIVRYSFDEIKEEKKNAKYKRKTTVKHNLVYS